MTSAGASSPPATPPQARRRRKGQRVLVVEDDPLLGMDIEAALRDAGAAEVLLCRSMGEAAALLESWAPHAVVLDVRLSDRNDGWALAELVSLLGARPPRIAFSTGSPEEIPEDVRRLGPVYAKPYDTSAMARALLQVPTPHAASRMVGRWRDALR